jgi:hypothetical protein
MSNVQVIKESPGRITLRLHNGVTPKNIEDVLNLRCETTTCEPLDNGDLLIKHKGEKVLIKKILGV